MPKHHAWVEVTAEELRYRFDAITRWQRIREALVLRSVIQLAQGGAQSSTPPQGKQPSAGSHTPPQEPGSAR
jgi:hypothetical protein